MSVAKLKTIDPLVALKLKKLELLKAEERRKECLPHLHAFKMYPWQRTFFESRNPINLVVGPNQVGKSVINIRKAIHWATEPDLWPDLFPRENPRLFFYFYPSLKLASREVMTKWIPLLLPKGEMKDDPQYGWKIEMKNGDVQRIKFHSGVVLEFMSYSMSPLDLQASSPHAIFADEEMPESLFGEVIARLMATKGYFHMIFTATLSQECWREALEEGTRFPQALKIQFSLYECLRYEDGTPTFITEAEIEERKSKLTSQWEVEIRIYGRFAKAEGLLFQAFDRYANVVDPMPVPPEWRWYVGVDVGSGGGNHPAAIAFVAISPDFKLGRVVRCWRGDKQTVTTAPSVLAKYHELKSELRIQPTGIFYDWASKDFETFAIADGVPVIKAEKSHEIGIPLMNGLFKAQRLMIDETDENMDLVRELLSVRIGQSKKHRADDACDAVRYAITKVPWNLEGLSGVRQVQIKKQKEGTAVPVRSFNQRPTEDLTEDQDAEINYWREHFEH